jgi:hypothetical protein
MRARLSYGIMLGALIAAFSFPAAADLIQTYTQYIDTETKERAQEAKNEFLDLMSQPKDINQTHVKQSDRDQTYKQNGNFGSTDYQQPDQTADMGINMLQQNFTSGWMGLFGGGATSISDSGVRSGTQLASNIAAEAPSTGCAVPQPSVLATPIAMLAMPIAEAGGTQGEEKLKTKQNHFQYKPKEKQSQFQVQEPEQQDQCKDDDKLAPQCGQ